MFIVNWRMCMDESAVRRLCQNFYLGKKNTYDEERSGRPQIITKEMMSSIIHHEVINYQFYNPNLVPSDYHLFRNLKYFWQEKYFEGEEELKEAVLTYLNTLAA